MTAVGVAAVARALARPRPDAVAAAPGAAVGARPRRAAVAVILNETAAGARVLLIERARHPGDPWSGDLAFPGGRVEAQDADERAAAERETLEEVGLDLSAATCLGRLPDRAARIRPLTICAFVYAVDAPPDLVLSAEVADAFWVPVADLVDGSRCCGHELRDGDAVRRFPAIDLLGPGRPRLWGVTYAFLDALLGGLGHPLPQSAPPADTAPPTPDPGDHP